MKRYILAMLLTGIMPGFAQIKCYKPSDETGSSAAVTVDRLPLVHTIQLFPFNIRGVIVGKNDLATQVAQVFKNATAVLKQSGSGLDQVVKVNVHISNEKDVAEVTKLMSVRFSGKTKPAVTYIPQPLWNGAKVAMDMVAVSNLKAGKVQYISPKSIYHSQDSKAAILPEGGVTYISGQAVKGNLEQGTHGTIQQLDASLKHLGMSKQDVVQIKAYMNNTAEIGIVEKELTAYFPANAIPPVVYTQWTSNEYEIEIEMVAASPKETTKRDTAISFLDLPGMNHSPVYAKVAQVNHGKLIYFSGLYGTTSNDSKAQTAEIFESLRNLLIATNSDFNHLAKATYFPIDAAGSTALNVIRPKFYDPHRAPAATKAILKTMPDDKTICVDMIGVER